ncbi:hypothetical protein HX021_10405 [Sphingobacterium sp. N143]|nr:hypothetical protein [Sphingobacterium sp. N143]MDM1294700.1 hypothetical protein [Sphingobacterium sp. N143]
MRKLLTAFSLSLGGRIGSAPQCPNTPLSPLRVDPNTSLKVVGTHPV